MATKSTRIRNSFRASETIIKDLADTYIEMERLIKYYEDEIKQAKILMKAIADKDILSLQQGKIIAYSDHIAEITYIKDMLKGVHHDILGVEDSE